MDGTINPGEKARLPAVALADKLERLPEEEARQLFEQMPPEQAASVIAELETADAGNLLKTLPDAHIAAVLELLPRTIATDLLGYLPEEQRQPILSFLTPPKAAAISALLRYTPESAGGNMDTRFVAVRSNDTVEQGLGRVRLAPVRPADDISYIYVTDENEQLKGVVSLRDLVFSPTNRRIHEIMNANVRFVRVTDDQEEIAKLIHHANFLGLPVVDEGQRLVGVVRMREAIRVTETEATEDMQLMVGLSGEERVWTRWNTALGKRLPWLGVNTLTTLLAAAVVSLFEETITRWAALVAFLPMISAVGGNAGMQALTVIIRALALGDVAPGDAVRALRKELAIGAAGGVVLGCLIGLIAYGWKGSLLLGIVCGAAMLLNLVVGTLCGVAVPFGLRRCGIDPAMASSIFVTTLTDMVGFLIFLGLATAAMHAYGL